MMIDYARTVHGAFLIAFMFRRWCGQLTMPRDPPNFYSAIKLIRNLLLMLSVKSVYLAVKQTRSLMICWGSLGVESIWFLSLECAGIRRVTDCWNMVLAWWLRQEEEGERGSDLWERGTKNKEQGRSHSSIPLSDEKNGLCRDFSFFMADYLLIVSLKYIPPVSFFNLRASGNVRHSGFGREGKTGFYSPLIYPRWMEKKLCSQLLYNA